MSTFEIKEQVNLPMSKCVELVLSGVEFRLFRASITVAIIALAVAFLMTILGDSLIGRRVGDSLVELTKPRRTFLFWVHRLTTPVSSEDIGQTLASAQPGDTRWEEFKTWGKCDDQALSDLKDIASKEATYLAWFAGLKEGQRRRLVGRASGREILSALQNQDAFATLASEMPAIGEQAPFSTEEFRVFLADWAKAQPRCQRIADGHGRAIKDAATVLAGQNAQEMFARANEGTTSALGALGFGMTADDLKRVKERAEMNLKARHIERLLLNPTIKQRVATWYGIREMNRVSGVLLFEKLCSRGEVKRFLGLLAELKVPFDMSAEDVRATAQDQVYTKHLADIESSITGIGQERGRFGFSTRVLWLIIVSLVVCAVGIANAMLMSVTERFKEIATMKCLGSTDGFIMINFLLESGLQGLAGGIIGGVLGLILGVLRSSWGYGLMTVQNLPIVELAVVFAASVAAGVVLSILAAIYPAWVAARLAPMEAMRVE